MNIRTPLNKQTVSTHFTYCWWMYLVLIAATVFGWNLIYTTTAYRSPEDKRIDIYVQSSTASENGINKYMESIGKDVVPDMETINTILLTAASDDYYANMQLMVYVYAREGDIFMLSTDDFKNLASQGVFVDLGSYITSGALNTEGLDLSSGYVAMIDDDGNTTSEIHLFGVPAYTLNAYSKDINVNNRNMVLAVTNYSGNEENAVRFLNELIQRGRE